MERSGIVDGPQSLRCLNRLLANILLRWSQNMEIGLRKILDEVVSGVVR